MRLLGIYAKGMAMGAADIVPGVSGGTVAFITGIYPTLLRSIASFDIQALKLLLRGDIAGVWNHVNGRFIVALLAGIATSLLTLARAISWLLHNYPQPLWGFFFGLIGASALLLLRQVPHWQWRQISALLLGVVVAVAVGLLPRAGFIEGYTGVFLAGFIAICAMILPGISGSFILVLLGMYSTILAALKGFDIPVLVVFTFGAAAGLMTFSRILQWLMDHYFGVTVALLTGFLFGSLSIVWPWKRVLEWIAGSDGELKPARQWPVLPDEFLARTGEDPMVAVCVVLAFVGFLLIWLIDRRWGRLQIEST
ncbi:DUF368 domain-containing protein [Halieaceae bacterium IMCC14734]|uniref:DUF368 domain-containing protein n=1 Tax=Candidatus Litorirhabdus singularis TaxID=2518993 RepID=A0ABT3TK18_9GAMM|nr:DUF368 domain-containing protein [Candidatus Litorirhabdus singularis]MCX2982130.1 DUF368 domain-containing protein [Candidatus Litorirhabdus singularis]